MDKGPRTLDAIVEFQVKRWAAESSTGRRVGATPMPVITLSREYGALGAALAQRVAERLEFKCWDQELVHQIAVDAGASDRMIATLDEHRRNAFGEVLSSFMAGTRVTASDYFERLARTIHTISSHGRAVIVGRGAQFILKPEEALRVRVIAPEAARVAGLSARRGLSEREARSELKDTDHDRRTFIRQTYDKDVNVPTHYDLLVNTSAIPVERAVDVVVAGYHAKFPQAESTVGARAR